MNRTDSVVPAAMRILEPLLVALFGWALYSALQGELAYHDAFRFTNQINSGHAVWDIGHIFMQPATLLWHRIFNEPAELSQKHIHAVATAFALGVFDVLLRRLNAGAALRAAAILLVATSGSVLILAPSAHMKLLAFPIINTALLVLATWEQSPLSRGTPRTRTVLAGGALLAVAGSFLASALATAPFATAAVGLTALRRGLGWPRSILLASLFAASCGLVFLLLAVTGFALFAHAAPSLHGLLASVGDKAGLRPVSYSPIASIARLIYGTGNNIAEAPQLGTIIRAWISGAIPSLTPYRHILLLQGVPLLITLSLLAATYMLTIRHATAGARCLVPAAFLCGAQLWTIYYGLNDPEHWFQLTVPSVLLFIMLCPPGFTRFVLPAWAILVAGINIGAFALPYAAYPVSRYRNELQHEFTGNDLLIGFAAYSGNPSLFLLQLPDIPQLMLDTQRVDAPDAATFYASTDTAIRQVFARHGRAIIFGGILDPTDFNAPWIDLPPLGVTKQGLHDFFYQHYTVTSRGRIADIPAWELTPHGP